MRRIIVAISGLAVCLVIVLIAVYAMHIQAGQNGSTATAMQLGSEATTAAVKLAPTTQPTLAATSEPSAEANGVFQWHLLTDATAAEVGQYAISYARATYDISASPTIRMSKLVSWKEAKSLGIPPGEGDPNSPDKYWLVTLQGDLTTHGNARSEPQTMHYVAYLFDLDPGLPTTTIASKSGAEMKVALNDPSLPSLTQPMFIDGPFPTPDLPVKPANP